ncbi:MAG: tail fiber protein [Verrucomicrobiota bacterium]
MSTGGITITPGKVWTEDESITNSKLAETSQPTGRLDEASVGSRELIAEDVEALAANVAAGQNLFRNGGLLLSTWQTLDGAGVSCPDGVRTFPLLEWFARPTGAAATAVYNASDVGGTLGYQSLQVSGNTGLTTLEVGQYVPPELAKPLATGSFTVSFFFKNNSGTSMTPRLLLRKSNTAGDEEDVSEVLSEDLVGQDNATWLRQVYTVDPTGLGLDAGFELVVQVSGGLLAAVSKSILLAEPQLERTTQVTPWKAPAGAELWLAGLAALPAGSVMPFAGTTLPRNFLWAAGQAVSRTTYAALFAALGTTYGAGDGSTTFNLPDLRGRVAAGKDDMGGSAASRLTSGGAGGIDGAILGTGGGGQQHVLTSAQMPSHTHAGIVREGSFVGWKADGNTSGVTWYAPSPNPASASTNAAGGNQPHNIVQPTLVLNYIIHI